MNCKRDCGVKKKSNFESSKKMVFGSELQVTEPLTNDSFVDSSDEDEKVECDITPFHVDWVDLTPYQTSQHFAVSALPGRKFKETWRNVAVDVEYISKYGIKSVYVLLTPGELRKYRVPTLLEEYEKHGIVVHHHPFLDGTAPEVTTMMNILLEMTKDLENNQTFLIHCFGGKGRTCLVSSCLLLHLDPKLNADEVVAKMKSIRGSAAIQTFKQLHFIEDFRRLVSESNAEAKETISDNSIENACIESDDRVSTALFN